MTILNHIVAGLRNLIPIRTYSSDLEEYVESRRPQSSADIERYTREYHQKISKGGWI